MAARVAVSVPVGAQTLQLAIEATGTAASSSQGATDAAGDSDDDVCVDACLFDPRQAAGQSARFSIAASTGFHIWSAAQAVADLLGGRAQLLLPSTASASPSHSSKAAPGPASATTDAAAPANAAPPVVPNTLPGLAVPVGEARILELGSGSGLGGLAAAACGAEAMLTDLECVVEGILAENVAANSAAVAAGGGRVAATALDWTAPLPPDLAGPARWDLVLAADCIWLKELVPPFVATVAQLLRQPGGVQPPAAACLLAFCERAKADSQFFASAAEVLAAVASAGLQATLAGEVPAAAEPGRMVRFYVITAAGAAETANGETASGETASIGETASGETASGETASGETAAASPAAPERLQRAQTVVSQRTGRFLLVLERTMDSHNYQAALRTAEALGVQHVWFVEPLSERRHDVTDHKMLRTITRASNKWLTLRDFASVGDCLAALRREGYAIWASDLSPEAVAMDEAGRRLLTPLPPRLALVIGCELRGVSSEMLAAADRRVYFPIVGFTESLNLSVAAALMLQRLFDWCPEARGDLPEEEKRALRREWFPMLLKNPTARQRSEQFLQGDGFERVEAIPDLRKADKKPFVRKRILARAEEAGESFTSHP